MFQRCQRRYYLHMGMFGDCIDFRYFTALSISLLATGASLFPYFLLSRPTFIHLCHVDLFFSFWLGAGTLLISWKTDTDQREEQEGGRKQNGQKQNEEGRSPRKVLTWMIPERIVTVAATITLYSSADESLLIELLESSRAAVLSDGVNLTTTAPTIILRTGNGPN